MAKKKVKSISYINKHQHTLRVYKCFVYEIEMYVNTARSFYLYDTKIILLQKSKFNLNSIKIKPTHTLITRYTLLAAPIDWLEEHNYTKNGN